MATALVSGPVGCSSDGDGPKKGDSPAPGTSASASTAPTTGTGTPDPSPSPPQSPDATGTVPAPSTSAPAPAPSPSPPASEATLVAVTRSGGLAGRNSSLIIKGDGSFLRLDAKAEVIGRDKLSAAALAKLRTALQEADFPHLPRLSMGGSPVPDGFTYAFRHGGYEVAAEQSKMPKGLSKVLDALPPFSTN
ncbi:hypothetical protein ACWGDE_14175 [Streptomyces sp. NPDC054956]